MVGVVVFLVLFAYLLLTYTRRVESTSMLPTLEPGDLVVLANVPISDVKLGDVIVYEHPCVADPRVDLVVHRVVDITSNGLITKGDNNPYLDQSPNEIGAGPIANSPITQGCLVGKVVYVVPYVERLASLPYGTNYILALAILLLVLYSEFRGRTSGVQKGRVS